MSLKPMYKEHEIIFPDITKCMFFLKFEKYKHLFTKQQNYIVLHSHLSPKYKVINLHLQDKNKE